MREYTCTMYLPFKSYLSRQTRPGFRILLLMNVHIEHYFIYMICGTLYIFIFAIQTSQSHEERLHVPIQIHMKMYYMYFVLCVIIILSRQRAIHIYIYLYAVRFIIIYTHLYCSVHHRREIIIIAMCSYNNMVLFFCVLLSSPISLFTCAFASIFFHSKGILHTLLYTHKHI